MTGRASEETAVWFVTAPRSSYAVDRQTLGGWTTHAKTAGTLLTACGANAGSWRIVWERPFPSPGLATCHVCLDVVAHDRERREPALPSSGR